MRSFTFLLFLITIMLSFLTIVRAQSGMRHLQIRNGKYVGTDTVDLAGYSRIDKAGKNGRRVVVEASVNAAFTVSILIFPAACGDSNGSILVETSGGQAPFQFTIVDQYGDTYTQNLGNFTRLMPYSYTLTVVDADGDIQTVPFVVPNLYDGPDLQISGFAPVSDCDASDAWIELNPIGGTPPFEYTIDGVNFQSSNRFENLTAGTYFFLVRDANGCISGETNFVIGTLMPFNCQLPVGVSYSGYSCNNNGSIDFKVYDNVNAPYTYSIDGVNYFPVGLFENLNYGLHKIYYRNASGKIYTHSINIFYGCNPILNFSSDATACNGNSGTATVTMEGGFPPYEYSIDGVNFQSGNVFTGLYRGYYTVIGRDSQGNTLSGRVFVDDKCPAMNLAAENENCGAADGTIQVTPTNGVDPFEFSIDGSVFQTSPIFTGLSGGLYTVTMRDADGNVVQQQIEVADACLLIDVQTVRPRCGEANGSLTIVSVTGGQAPFLYSLDGINFQLSNQFTGLGQGTYTVRARDLNGIIGTRIISLTDQPGPQLTLVAQPVSCVSNDGTIAVVTSGGTAPLQFSIDGTNFSSQSQFLNLTANSYTIWVRDALGCSASASVVVGSNCPQPQVTIVNETCADRNGSISMSGTGGTTPYMYSLDGVSFQNNPLFENLPAGSYQAYIRDALGAINSISAEVANLCPVVTLTANSGYCSNSDGSISAIGSGGTAPYLFSLNNGPFSSTDLFTGLSDGIYTVTVRDAMGLLNQAVASIQNFPGPQLSILTIDASCVANDGQLQLNAQGGTVPYTYRLNGQAWQNNAVMQGLAPGNYVAEARDQNGCTASAQAVVVLNNNLVLNIPQPYEICEGSSVTPLVNSNAASYSWSPAAGINDPGIRNPEFSPLQTTRYQLDARLGVCLQTAFLDIEVKPAPRPDAGVDQTVCYGAEVQLQGSGGQQYFWTPSSLLQGANTSAPVWNPATTTSTFFLHVIDQHGCQSLTASEITVTVTPPARLFAGNDTAIVRNQPFQLQAVDVGSSGFTNYSWSPSTGLSNPNLANPIVSLSSPQRYVITARTPEGCSSTDDIYIKVYAGPELYVPTAFSPNNDGLNDRLYVVPVGISRLLRFTIFNRWGETVFTSTNSQLGWDGRRQGVLLDPAVFTWIAEGIDDQGRRVFRKGTVTLVR